MASSSKHETPIVAYIYEIFVDKDSEAGNYEYEFRRAVQGLEPAREWINLTTNLVTDCYRNGMVSVGFEFLLDAKANLWTEVTDRDRFGTDSRFNYQIMQPHGQEPIRLPVLSSHYIRKGRAIKAGEQMGHIIQHKVIDDDDPKEINKLVTEAISYQAVMKLWMSGDLDEEITNSEFMVQFMKAMLSSGKSSGSPQVKKVKTKDELDELFHRLSLENQENPAIQELGAILERFAL